MEEHKDIKLYKSSYFDELSSVDGRFTVEIKEVKNRKKARVKSQELFGELRGDKSRFNTLQYVGGSSGGGEPTINRYRLRINYEDYYFKIVKPIN